MFYLDPQTLKRYTLGTPFTYNGIQITAAGATHAKFIELGFTQVLVGPRPDSRFYVVLGPDQNGDYSQTPRNLTDLKTNFKREQKQQAHNILRGTDWYVVRLAELGVVTGVMPADVSTFRAAYRTAASTRCTEIDACTTVQELETLITAPAQLYDINTETYSTNPVALTQWPDELAETYSFSSY